MGRSKGLFQKHPYTFNFNYLVSKLKIFFIKYVNFNKKINFLFWVIVIF